MPYPLAVISRDIGKESETFIYRHMAHLMPGATVVIARNKIEDQINLSLPFPHLVLGKPRKDLRWISNASRYLLKLSSLSPVQLTVAKYLKKNRVQVILCEYLDQSLKWLVVAKKLGIRFFAHAHGYDISIALRDPDMCKQYLRLNEADGIITVSEVSRQRLISLGLIGVKIYVVPCGVDVPIAQIERSNHKIVRCLAVGRMVNKKAPLMTLQAFRQAKKFNPNIHLDYIGDGELFNEAIRFVFDNGLTDHVTLHGSQPNTVVQDLMKQSDIFLQHSRIDPETGDEEGLPVAILEAMANGIPVVSTRHAGIPEAVVEGETGYLVDENDVDSMAEKVTLLARSPALRTKFGIAGWSRAKNRFTWDKERNALLELMKLKNQS